VVRCEPAERVEVAGTVIPLKAGQSFQVGGEHVRCLPADFPVWNVQRSGAATTPPFAATAGAYAIVADPDGVPVWWMRTPTGEFPTDATIFDSDTIAWSYNHFNSYATDATFELRRFDGALKSRLGAVDFHDLQALPNGDYLAIAYVPRDHVDLTSIGGPSDATVVDNEIRELAPDGGVVWRWSTKDHIDVSESRGEALVLLGTLPYDLVHMNSVQDDGDGIVFSARHLDAVYRINKATGAIDWKLGGTHRPESVSFVNDPIGKLAGQHDARLDATGTLSAYDNELLKADRPRAVRYRINPQARTATLLSSISEPDISASGCCGSVRSVPNGHTLVSWGQQPLIAEYDASGSRVLTIGLGTDVSYRAIPAGPDAPSLDALRAGMDAMAPR
jgi:hypothetical protein